MKHPKFVICIDNSDHPISLEKLKIYQAIADLDAAKTEQIRVIDESGKDYLYPTRLFIDAKLSKETQAAVARAIWSITYFWLTIQ